MSSSTGRLVTGTARGTGDVVTVNTVGFKPKRVELKNLEGKCLAIWQDTMPQDSAQKILTSDTNKTDISFVDSDAISTTTSGFSIGADTDINVDGQIIHWCAWD
jgi:hypothetical protein